MCQPSTVLAGISAVAHDSLPNHDKRGCKFLGLFGYPLADVFGSEPVAAFDFVGVQRKGTCAFAAVNPDVFLVGFGGGGEFEQAGWRRSRAETEFFAEFAHGARVVIFAGIDMAGG